VVWTWSTTAVAREHGVAPDQLEALVDVIRATAEADVACVVKGQDDGSWVVSMRSRGATDLSRVAMVLGGGGHRAAAGYSSTLDLETTMAKLRVQLSQAAPSR
jgi:phosphoesterase RecJ-like protein